MLKGFILGIAATIAAALIVTYVAVKGGLVPSNADAMPNHLERWAASTALRARIRRETAGMQDPLQLTDENVSAGAKLYAQHCALCHGDASGKPTYAGFGLYQKAPALGFHGVEDDPEAETYWKVTHGIRWTGMPSFGKTLSDTQRWQLALFLKNMDKLGPGTETLWKKVTAPALPEAILRTLPRRRHGEGRSGRGPASSPTPG